jgi:peptidoglycan hydrolase-like protein with peptidoglycan-binding domain
MLFMCPIRSSVGAGATNERKDVHIIQLLLNSWLAQANQTALNVNGIADSRTISAIRAFQQGKTKQGDGRIDPDDPTLEALCDVAMTQFAAGMKVPPIRRKDLLASEKMAFLQSLASLRNHLA